MFSRHQYFAFGQSRMFERGHLKYVILELIKEKPMHGYEIIREMENHFHGLYTPSAGSVYPTLQMLEDLDYVKSTEQDGKKVYSITEAGTAFLKEHEETREKIKGQMHEWFNKTDREDLWETMGEFKNIARTLRGKLYRLDSEKLAKIREIVRKAGSDIDQVLENK